MVNARLGMLGSLSALAAALAFSCGSDEGTSPNVHDGGAGGGESVPRAGESSGASSNSGSGGAGVAGTSAGGTAGGGTGGDGGTTSSAGATPSDAGAGGTPLTPEGEQLELCERLTGLVPHSTKVTQEFRNASIRDCRITQLIPRASTGLDDWVQALLIWNLELWGCQGSPVTRFVLAKPGATLSAGDASVLIETYMNIADAELDLSPPEFTEMRAAIERLSTPVVVSPSMELSQSKCVVPGAGGAGGEGGGAPGLGGEASSLAGQGGAP